MMATGKTSQTEKLKLFKKNDKATKFLARDHYCEEKVTKTKCAEAFHMHCSTGNYAHPGITRSVFHMQTLFAMQV